MTVVCALLIWRFGKYEMRTWHGILPPSPPTRANPIQLTSQLLRVLHVMKLFSQNSNTQRYIYICVYP